MSAHVSERMNDELATPCSKRRRLNSPDAGQVAIETALYADNCEPSARTTPTTSACGTKQEIGPNTLVCYGMISDLQVTVSLQHVASLPSSQSTLCFEPPSTLHYGSVDKLAGELDDRGSKLLLTLVADDELILQFVLSAAPIASATQKKAVQETVNYLGVIIYGARRYFSDVGEFMNKAGSLLDDPIGCDHNVPYMNPQCLYSLHEQPPMTFDLLQLHQPQIDKFERAAVDALSGFETTDALEVSPTPRALSTELKVHQKEALTFLLRRERGMHPYADGYGVWLRKWDDDQSTFVNAFTHAQQSTPGPMWRGGLLADEMGLGKTLSMIALIASDHDNFSSKESPTTRTTSDHSLYSTLVVVPLNLFSVWGLQLKSHVHDGKLTWFMHHGRQRFKLKAKDRPPDIVFTTYQTIERENRSTIHSSNSVFSYHWRRLILDEAHIVRNHTTSTARAIATIRATSRWAVSGTPIQNSLLDFHGLFKFLHFSPYDDPKIFDDDVTNLWRVKPNNEAAQTFKQLLSCVMIRRTKAILDLPSRKDKLIPVPFSHEEEKYYRQVERPVIEMLDRTTGNGSQPNHPWMTAIQQINKLRLICNLGVYNPTAGSSFSQPASADEQTSVMHARYSMGGETCAQCFQPIEAFTNSLHDASRTQVYYSACNDFYCADCSNLLQHRSPDPCDCVQSRTCRLRPLASSLSTPGPTPTGHLSPSPMGGDPMDGISSKVRALVSRIRSFPQDKHVVFSSWTTSLDMVERALRCDPAHCIPSVRIDGRVHLKYRNQAIQRLHTDPTIRVILITIACGACGLDLTAASVVHLLEPQWNPSTEDQALARVHRLGQNRSVTTIRYVMEDSFEEHILKVQDRKKLLATTLLSNGSSLENLRQLLHESKSKGKRTLT